MTALSQEKLASYLDSGLWGNRSLDSLLQMQAEKSPDKLALCDPPNRNLFLESEAKRLTYRQLNQIVDRLAALFIKMGLKKNNVICNCLPNCVESIICVIASWRAGLIVVPVSCHWRSHELNMIMPMLQPEAVITMASIGSHEQAKMMRHVARDNFSIRFVFGFSAPLPDGVISLDELLNDDYDTTELDIAALKPNSANDVAAVTFSVSGKEAPTPIARTHNHILAAGIYCYVEAGMLGNENIITCLSLSSIVGFATSLVPWLLCGGKLVLHQPFDRDLLTRQINDENIHSICLPAGLVHIADEWQTSSLRCIWALWQRMMPNLKKPKPHKSLFKIVDTHNFAEIALAVIRRQGFNPSPIVVDVNFPSWSNNKNVALSFSFDDIRQTANKKQAFSHTIACAGAQTPEITLKRPQPLLAPSHSLSRAKYTASYKKYQTDEIGFAQTGLLCNIDNFNDKDCIKSYSYGEDVVFHGSIPLSVVELEKIYTAYDQAEVAVAIELADDNFGSKIVIVMQISSVDDFEQDSLISYLHKCSIASYKIVDSIYIVEQLPVFSNGTIDRQALYSDLLQSDEHYHSLSEIRRKIS